MKLKVWVEALLIIIAIASGILMMYDVEISMIPFIVGGIIFISTCSILCEYGRLFQYLTGKLEQLLHK